MKRAVCIGECMVEMAQENRTDRFTLGFAGDTYNTAVYLKRHFADAVDVAYLTALGDDALSHRMINRFREEAIQVDLIRIFPGKRPGLYLIENDEKGERFFQYWRSESAARSMFAGWSPRQLNETLAGFDLIYISGISLAILDEDQRRVLFETLRALSGKTTIAFDPNFRPALCPGQAAARQAFEVMGGIASIVLVSRDDEVDLWTDTTKEAMISRWCAWGCREVVLKEGPRGCLIAKNGERIQVPVSEKRRPLDTTGAGDSFCAGYLGERMNGNSIQQAARTGHRIAARVIMRRGAIIPREQWLAITRDG